MVLSGAGVNHAKANEVFTEFVTRHQLPVVSTLLGLGAIPYENPYFRYGECTDHTQAIWH